MDLLHTACINALGDRAKEALATLYVHNAAAVVRGEGTAPRAASSRST